MNSNPIAIKRSANRNIINIPYQISLLNKKATRPTGPVAKDLSLKFTMYSKIFRPLIANKNCDGICFGVVVIRCCKGERNFYLFGSSSNEESNNWPVQSVFSSLVGLS